MIDANIEELMWLEIDETISSTDREALYAYLESHGEALEHLEQLRQMALLFGQAGEIDPPSELRERILHAIEVATPPKARRVGVLERLGAFLAPRPAWKLAVAGAAGVFIGVVGYHLILHGLGSSGSLDVTQLYGTMNFEGIGDGRPALRIDVPGVTGTLSVSRDDSRALSELNLSSEREIEIVVQYGGSPLTVAVSGLSDDPSKQVAIQDGEVRVRNRGKGAYHLLFALHEDPLSPIMVKVLSEGKVLFEGEVAPAPAGKTR